MIANVQTNPYLKRSRVNLLQKAFATLFSFEAVFVLYLFAGRFKEDPRFAWIPVDLTALFFALSIVIGFFILLRRKFRLTSSTLLIIGAMLGFISWSVASLAWTPGRIYANEKAFYMVTLNLWALAAPAWIIATEQKRLRRFFLIVLLFALWVVFESLLLFFQANGSGFIYTFGGHYLSTSRVLSLAVGIALSYWLLGKNVLFKAACLALVFLFFFVLFISGGRGPAVAALGACLYPVVIGWRVSRAGKDIKVRRYQFWLFGLFILATSLLTYLIATGQLTQTLYRFTLLFTQAGGGTSASGRLEAFGVALALWQQSPFIGGGVGSFPVYWGVGDFRSYPHNIFLETLAELGLVGLILLLGLFAAGLRRVRLRDVRQAPWKLATLLLLINTFLNAQVTGDFSDNRPLFTAVGLLACFRGSHEKH